MKLYTQLEANDLTFNAASSFEDCEFNGIDFSSHSLKSVAFLDCKFSGCNFANQLLNHASMRGVAFVNCNLIGINWTGLKRLESSNFYDSKLNFSIFQGMKLKKIEIKNCSATEVDFSGADLSSCDFSESSFAGADFAGAILVKADFRTSRDYVFDLRTANIKGAKFTSPYVLALITALGAEVDE